MEEKDFNIEDLENFEESKIEFESKSNEVNDGKCMSCNEKLVKVLENRNLLNGAITFHIIKLRCPKCKKEYLDLDEAEKYDFFLLLEKAIKQPLDKLNRKLSYN